MPKKFYYLYKITNIINWKYYIGVHSTNNLDDGYFGSGFVLKRAIKKYGKEKFRFEIMEWFDTVEDMYKREKEIVNEDFVNKDDTYNIHGGGFGCSYMTLETRKKLSISHKGKTLSELTKEKMRISKIGKNKTLETKEKMKKPKSKLHIQKISESKMGEKNPMFGKSLSESHIQKISKSNSGERSYWYGKSHSEKTKKKISNKLKGKRSVNFGKSLSEETKKKLSKSKKGRKYINKGGKNKIVKPEDIYKFIECGWKEGKKK